MNASRASLLFPLARYDNPSLVSCSNGFGMAGIRREESLERRDPLVQAGVVGRRRDFIGRGNRIERISPNRRQLPS